MNEFDIENQDDQKIASADSSRRAAKWFNYGTIVAAIIPVPLFIFWTGLSMLIYALNKHHPNPIGWKLHAKSSISILWCCRCISRGSCVLPSSYYLLPGGLGDCCLNSYSRFTEGYLSYKS